VKRNITKYQPLTIIFAENPLKRDTWQRFDNYLNLCEFLLKEVAPKYNGHFPTSGKIYQEFIDKEHEITPASPASAEALAEVRGTVYVVIWPAAQALAVQAAVTVGMFLLTSVLKTVLAVPDEKATNRVLPQGSPNNLPGQRKNTARVLQRIPDIYGQVKCTPDLLQFPYIAYSNNLQVETIVACIGRGDYDVQADQIFEGQTPIQQIPGVSLAIYPPGEVPGSGTSQLQIGPAIDDPLLTVVPVREVTGEQILAPNNTMIWCEDDEREDPDYTSDPPIATMFGYPSSGVGTVTFFYANDKRTQLEGALYFTNRLNVGDKFGLRWQGNSGGSLTDRGAVSIERVDLVMGAGGDANIPNLELLPETDDDDYYEVTAVDVYETAYPGTVGFNPAVEYTIAVPASMQAEWAKIAVFNSSPPSPPDGFPNTVFNRMALIYLLNYRLGPFFCNDANMEEIHVNFIADKGLWVDDGRRQKGYGAADHIADPSATGGIDIVIEVTPADADGIATGAKELHTVTMLGSSFKRDFIGSTFKIIPSFTGRFLISAYRNLWHYWRTVPFAAYDHPSNSFNPYNWAETGMIIEDVLVVPHNLQFSDDIKWTHCYSVSTPKYYPFTAPLESLGDVTIVHAKTTQVKFAPQKEFEKNLNMIVTRSIPFWDGDSFPSEEPTTRGLDAAFHVMRSYYLGNVDDDNIDFVGITDAFNEVFQAFGNVEATEFHHTFDSEQASFEDLLTAVGEACFITFYRQGNIIKASADVSKPNASLLFNHRNMVPDGEGNIENRRLSFGTEEEYDGVEIEYSDNLDNQLKTYIAPTTIVIPRNPQKIRVAGVRTKVKAAMHAWRAANRLLYQNTTTEFESCDEACLAIIKDKVLIANTTDLDMQDGDIVRIDGLTVHTSQEIIVSGSSSYTLFIQDVDGSVQSIPVVTDETPHSLVLDGAPSGTLVIDADAGIFPRYILVRDQDSTTSAFHINETQYKNRGVYGVVATNYTEGYYFNDAIRLWLVFNEYSGFPPVLKFFDRSPYEIDFEEHGSPTAVVDADRQVVYEGPDSNSYLLYAEFSGVTVVSYTVAAWVRLDSYSSGIVRSDDGLTSFAIAFDSGSTELEVTHEATVVAAYLGVELSEWTHIGVVYDESIEQVTIYINGEAEAVAVDVLPFDSFTGLRVFAMNGKGDDFRIYNKPKSAEFMRELYQKTLFPAF
jgi:hypothetical protein